MNPKCALMYVHGRGYKYWMDNISKLKFWGNSIDLQFTTPSLLHFTTLNEWYIIEKPQTKTSGILGGKPTTTLEGPFKVTNFTTGDYIECNAPAPGWTGKNAFKLEGTTFNSKKEKTGVVIEG